MTKEELEKYAHENRKRLDAQEVKIGDVVKVLRGQFAGETGVVVGIIACIGDYTDPYYEVDMDCEVPDKYKCRKNTLAQPNNVIGGLSAYDFEVIGNRAPMQSTEEVKVGDKVRVSKDAPEMYFFGCNYDNSDFKVILVDRDNAVITQIKNGSFAIPLKYLIKVEDESKEPKFKVGDRVRVKGYGYEPNLHKGDIGEILDINDKGQCFVLFKKSQAWIYADCLEPCTEPTEEVNLQDATREFVETHPFDIESLKRGRKVFEDMFWDTYAADLAKEIALKVANKYNDPEQAAEYAVKVAKAVVEGLKKK